MNKFSKVIAIALAATMVIGSSVTAFADDTEPVTTGDSTGDGTSEGHVEQKKINVVLPTIASGSTPFAYTMDPEGLIKATSAEKYGSTVEFPAASGDTQVYFNNGLKGGNGEDKNNTVYANSSVKQTVTNKSSHAISLTVKAEVTSPEATDIPLVGADDIATATAASLYLGLVVDSEDPVAIASDAAATQTVTVNGTAANFKVAYNSTDSKYEYRALTLNEWKASAAANADKTQDDYDATWAKSEFQLEGAVTTTKTITDTTTAPSIKVTWNWVDPEAAPEELTVSATQLSVQITGLEEGATLTSVTYKKPDNSYASLTQGTHWSYSNGTFTVLKAALAGESMDGAVWTLTFSKGDPVTITVQN